MTRQERQEAIIQIKEWAAAYVQNETCIPETPAERLSQTERNALEILGLTSNPPKQPPEVCGAGGSGLV